MAGEVKAELMAAYEVGMSNPDDALRLLEQLIERAEAIGDLRDVSGLAKQAAGICTLTGDHQRVLRYYERALLGDPEDACLHWVLGDTKRTLGLRAEARVAFARCRDLATAQGDAEVTGMAEEALAAMGDE